MYTSGRLTNMVFGEHRGFSFALLALFLLPTAVPCGTVPCACLCRQAGSTVHRQVRYAATNTHNTGLETGIHPHCSVITGLI